MNSINAYDAPYNLRPDGSDCTPGYNAALAAAIAGNIPTVYIPGGVSAYTYRFASKPNAVTGNVRVISEQSETCILLRDYNAGSASEPFIDASNGNGVERIQVAAANGTSGGIGILSAPSTQSGFQKFDGCDVTVQGTGTWGEAPMKLSGAASTNGLRDIHFSNNFIFGKLILDHVINIGGSANWAGDVVIQSSNSDASSNPCSDVALQFIAANSFTISNCLNFNIQTAYVNNAAGAVSIASSAANGILTIGNAVNDSYMSNNSTSVSVMKGDDRRSGTWTPTDASGAGLTLTPGYAIYQKIGKMFICKACVTYQVNADGRSAMISGLPVACGMLQEISINSYDSAGGSMSGQTAASGNGFYLMRNGQVATNAQLSGRYFLITAILLLP